MFGNCCQTKRSEAGEYPLREERAGLIYLRRGGVFGQACIALEDGQSIAVYVFSRDIGFAEDLLEVRIPLTNRPGIIAEVTTIASQVGCNVQSIDIDHITSSSAVLDMVLTDEGDIGKLSTQLIKAGFSISFNPLSKE